MSTYFSNSPYKAICNRRGEVPSPVVQRELTPPTIQAELIVPIHRDARNGIGQDSYLDKTDSVLHHGIHL